MLFLPVAFPHSAPLLPGPPRKRSSRLRLATRLIDPARRLVGYVCAEVSSSAMALLHPNSVSANVPNASMRTPLPRYWAAPMRQIVLPQSGHVPFVMGLPFFVVLVTGSFIVFFSLHFMQYASIAMIAPFPNSDTCALRIGTPMFL